MLKLAENVFFPCFCAGSSLRQYTFLHECRVCLPLCSSKCFECSGACIATLWTELDHLYRYVRVHIEDVHWGHTLVLARPCVVICIPIIAWTMFGALEIQWKMYVSDRKLTRQRKLKKIHWCNLKKYININTRRMYSKGCYIFFTNNIFIVLAKV